MGIMEKLNQWKDEISMFVPDNIKTLVGHMASAFAIGAISTFILSLGNGVNWHLSAQAAVVFGVYASYKILADWVAKNQPLTGAKPNHPLPTAGWRKHLL